MSENDYDLEGEVLAGRYVIERRVGEGGFAVVYRARHIELHNHVAIKVLKTRDGLSERSREVIHQQFLNEARTIAKLRHGAIVQALDLGLMRTREGVMSPWMALEWVQGQTLAEFFHARAGKPLSPRAALDLVRPVFQALALTHHESIAHRDVKPTNIMVVAATEHSPQRVMLMDFGVAKLMEDRNAAAGADDTRTTSEFATYTRRYGAREQALGLKTGPSTDVHALGLILVEALTGAPAYRASDEGPDGTLGLILSEVRPTPARFGLDVGAWEAVLARALDLVPANRYPNAGEFLAALDMFVGNAMASTAGSSFPSVPQSAPVSLAPSPPAAFTPTGNQIRATARRGTVPRAAHRESEAMPRRSSRYRTLRRRRRIESW